ncbi:MAG: hypothetical protein JJV98_06850 [Desulfosarcina sp.]|nr:hypothetical protein [Desulfobacterales bacterium]
MSDYHELHYRLQIEPDLEHFTFKGRTEMIFRPAEAVRQIRLNCLALAIDACRVGWDDKQERAEFQIAEEDEQLLIALPEPVAGLLTVSIDYHGTISDGMAGFYRSGYTVDGQTRPMAVTQFQESDARRAFPCFDHPRHKATFDVTMVVDRNLTALSNGAIAQETLRADGRKQVTFERTPRMSFCYLFCKSNTTSTKHATLLVKNKRVRCTK